MAAISLLSSIKFRSNIRASLLFSDFVKAVQAVGNESSVRITASVLYTIEKGISPMAIRFNCAVSPKNILQFVCPSSFLILQFLLDIFEDDFVGRFGLHISLWVDSS